MGPQNVLCGDQNVPVFRSFQKPIATIPSGQVLLVGAVARSSGDTSKNEGVNTSRFVHLLIGSVGTARDR